MAVAAVTAVALAAGGVATVRAVSGGDTQALCAYFDDTFGLYPGAPVTIRGVAVGTVRELEPDGPRVRVEMETDRRELPAATGAVIAHASILTDRRVELVDADPGDGPTLPDGACIDREKTRTPVSVSDALGSFSELVRQMTELGPDGAAPLEAVLTSAGDEFDGLGPTLNRELKALADMLATPDSFMDQLGALLDNSAELSTFVTGDWEDVKLTLQTFAPGLASIEEMLVIAKILVEKLSAAVEPLDRLFHEHFPYLMDTLNSTLPILTMVRTQAEGAQDLLAKIPGVVGMLQTMVAARSGSLGLDLIPARAEVPTPDASLACAALTQIAPDSCTVLTERSVAVPLPQLVLSTIGATP
ncbi:MAG TPA: MCE family protein [Nocardia sp.]|nr:MCE family protein [Nocardia sp.]HLS78393.1 MCE family protein [Nocardia sp.]